MYQSIPAVPIHPFATFPNPEGGAIAGNFSARGWGLRCFPSWRLADYNMADFAGNDTEFVCKWLVTHSLGWSFRVSVPLSLIIDE
jgi:hypothetical protein